MSAAGARAPVLSMEAARGTENPEDAVVFDLRVEASEFVIVLAPDPMRSALLADLAGGVTLPEDGRVLFLGHDWAGLPHDFADALRGRIGRVFHEGGWLPHLTVAENVMLPLLHHTRTTRPEVLERAAELSRAFGLPGLPLDRPGAAPGADLARTACVRAFLGDPSLLLLENPLLDGRVPELLAPLRDAIAAARGRGAACLWLTDALSIWEDANLPATQRLVLTDTGLRAGRRRA